MFVLNVHFFNYSFHHKNEKLNTIQLSITYTTLNIMSAITAYNPFNPFNPFNTITDKSIVENCVNNTSEVVFIPSDQNTISDVFLKIFEPDEAKELICKFILWRAQKETEWLNHSGNRKTVSGTPIVSGTIYPESIFCWACSTGRLMIAITLLNLIEDLDAHKWNGYAFREACKEGHIKTARYLFNRVGGFNPVDKRCAAFRWSVRNGHVETARFTFERIKDIYANAIALNPSNKSAIMKNVRAVVSSAKCIINKNKKVLVKERKFKAINEFIKSISV